MAAWIESLDEFMCLKARWFYYAEQDADDVINMLDTGDVLVFPGLDQFAIYYTRGRVITVEAKNDKSESAYVLVRNLGQIYQNIRFFCVYYHDHLAKKYFHVSRKSQRDIVSGAESYIGKTIPFSEYVNGEFYCTLWTYGVGFSTKVASPDSAPKTMSPLPMTILKSLGWEKLNVPKSQESDPNCVLWEMEVYHRYRLMEKHAQDAGLLQNINIPDHEFIWHLETIMKIIKLT